MKRILWVTDFNFNTNAGGSQKTDYFFIEEAKSRGYDITFFNHSSDRNILSSTYDLVITANLEQMIYQKKKFIVHYAINHGNHIRIEHDANEYLDQKDREKLFKSAKKCFFLSKYHYDSFTSMYGNIIDSYEVAMPFIDLSKFFDYYLEREDKILYAGYFHPWKGSNNFFEYALNNPEKEFVVCGWAHKLYCDRIKKIKNIEYIGKIDHNKMPDIYNKYKTLWFHPNKYEPFCRAVCEAIFCGIQLDCSRNIGAIYDLENYGLEKLKEISKKSPVELWNKIEESF